MKRFLSCLAVALLLFLTSTPAALAVSPIIQDDAGLLTEAEEASLAETMQQISEYGTPIFWTTDTQGNDALLAEQFYRSKIGTESGTLFMINMGTRLLTIHSDGEIYQTVTRSLATTITDNVYRYASSGDYYQCAASAFGQIRRLLQGERIARPMKLISNILLAVTLSLLIIYIYISLRYEQHRTTKKVKTAVPVSVLSGAAFSAAIRNTEQKMTKRVKTNLNSDSGHSGRGGFGGGGGFSGGSGHSGGGGSHRF